MNDCNNNYHSKIGATRKAKRLQIGPTVSTRVGGSVRQIVDKILAAVGDLNRGLKFAPVDRVVKADLCPLCCMDLDLGVDV